MTGLRIVVPGDGAGSAVSEPMTMADALVDMVARINAEGPVTAAVLLYENDKGAIMVRPLPVSMFVAKVLVAEAYDQLHPGRLAADD